MVVTPAGMVVTEGMEDMVVSAAAMEVTTT